MNVTPINNISRQTSFKQIFQPEISYYNEKQLFLANDMERRIDATKNSRTKTIRRPDILITTNGSDESLSVYACKRTYSYDSLSDEFYNKLFVGTYNHPADFNPEDIEIAKIKEQRRPENKIKQSFKQAALYITSLGSAISTIFCIDKIKKNKVKI